MVLTAASSPPWCPGLFAPIAGEISFTDLTPASGRQDHTTSPSADKHSRQQRRPRPSHPNLTFVTIAKRPLCVGRDGKDVEVICLRSEPKYFCEKGWTGKSLICPSGRRFTGSDDLSTRHHRARPGDPSSSQNAGRRRMDARIKSGHDDGRTAFRIASSHRRLDAFSANHHRGSFRSVLLHDDEDLAPDCELVSRRLDKGDNRRVRRDADRLFAAFVVNLYHTLRSNLLDLVDI